MQGFARGRDVVEELPGLAQQFLPFAFTGQCQGRAPDLLFLPLEVETALPLLYRGQYFRNGLETKGPLRR